MILPIVKSKKEFDLINFYNEESNRYDSRYVEPIHIIEDEIVSRLINKIYKKGKKVLDIGCGTGHVVELGAISQLDYLGVDISKGMIKKAQQKFTEHNFNLVDIANFQTERREIITCCYGPLNYMGLDRFISHVNRCISTGGKLLTILYSGKNNLDVSTPVELQKFYTAKELEIAFLKVCKNVSIKKMSFPEKPTTFADQWQCFDNSSENTNLESKYLVVEAIW